MVEQAEKKLIKTTGTVTSNKMSGTVTVVVHHMKKHPLYRKQYRVTKKYHVDTAGKEFAIGEQVSFVEVKPISKTKKWKVVDEG